MDLYADLLCGQARLGADLDGALMGWMRRCVIVFCVFVVLCCVCGDPRRHRVREGEVGHVTGDSLTTLVLSITTILCCMYVCTYVVKTPQGGQIYPTTTIIPPSHYTFIALSLSLSNSQNPIYKKPISNAHPSIPALPPHTSTLTHLPFHPTYLFLPPPSTPLLYRTVASTHLQDDYHARPWQRA